MQLTESQQIKDFDLIADTATDDDDEVAVTDITKKAFVSVIVEHNGENVWFNVKTYSRLNRSENFFGVVNSYLAQLPDAVKNKIFEAYKQIKEGSEEFARRRGRFENVREYSEWMKEVVAVLFEDFNYEHFKRWVMLNQLVFVPSNTKEVYEDRNDTMHTRDKTYLREEYIDLACSAYILRMMMPIWGIYIANTQNDYKIHKEFYAFRLISHSKLMDLPAIGKLSRYIPLFMTDQKQFSGAVFAGISKADYPEHMLAYYGVRKLPVADPAKPDEEHTLITGLHSHITNKFTNTKSNMARAPLNVKRLGTEDKTADANSRDEIQRSVLEQYHIAESLSRGDTQVGETILFQQKDGVRKLVERIEPSMPLALVERFVELQHLKFSEAPPRKAIQEVWRNVSMYVDTSPAMLENLSADQNNTIYGVTAALNWYRGNYFIAALLCATAAEHNASGVFDMCQSSRKGKFSKEVREKMRRYYPYEHVAGSAKVRKNAGEECVEMHISMLSENRWFNNLPADLTEEAVSNHRLILGSFDEIIVPENVRDEVANFFFSIADAQANKRDIVSHIKENRDVLISKL